MIVHQKFYRLHHSAVEMAKVSRLLIAVDEGKINKFKGKTLDEINVEDFAPIEAGPEERESSGEEEEIETDRSTKTKRMGVEDSSTLESGEEGAATSRKQRR